MKKYTIIHQTGNDVMKRTTKDRAWAINDAERAALCWHVAEVREDGEVIWQSIRRQPYFPELRNQ